MRRVRASFSSAAGMFREGMSGDGRMEPREEREDASAQVAALREIALRLASKIQRLQEAGLAFPTRSGPVDLAPPPAQVRVQARRG